MAQLSDSEIFSAALQAGFTPDQAVTMTAIAIAESGGNTVALNSVGEHSVGLWQINTAVHDWDPSVAENPLFNARMAFEVSGGGADITRWTVTHEATGSRYLAFRERAEAAAAAAGYQGAEGQWNAPLGYHDDGVGAALADSSSEPVFAVGEIPDAVYGSGVLDEPAAIADARESVSTSAFDRDGDGVFDAVEEWLGEDLHPERSNLAALGDPRAGHGAGHSDVESIDPSLLRNGQLGDSVLQDVAGGNDSLAAGAPANSWQAMVAAASADGVQITFSDAYRPLADQERLARELGLYSQGGRAAAPGTSNHGLGLAVDVNRTPETMAWLDENAADYGWVADVPREPWHFNYRAGIDPDPDRAPVGGVPSGEDAKPTDAFDRDGDGVYDSVESWLEDRGHALPEPSGETHAVDIDERVSQATILPASLAENAPDMNAQEVGGDHLSPLTDDEHSRLSEIFDRFDARIDGIPGSEGPESTVEFVPEGLRRELFEFVGTRDDLDSDVFASRFDSLIDEHQGTFEFDDLIGLFDFD